MFQWPKLPEMVFSVADYNVLKDNFTADPEVRLQSSPKPCVNLVVKHNPGSEEQG